MSDISDTSDKESYGDKDDYNIDDDYQDDLGSDESFNDPNDDNRNVNNSVTEISYLFDESNFSMIC